MPSKTSPTLIGSRNETKKNWYNHDLDEYLYIYEQNTQQQKFNRIFGFLNKEIIKNQWINYFQFSNKKEKKIEELFLVNVHEELNVILKKICD